MAAEECDISVVITTYNRSHLLPGALDSVLAQEAGGVSYEVIVVDNNSTDRTRQVVEAYIERGRAGLRYVFEARQGTSYGRNAGVVSARAPIIAFTDDDVQVAPDWIVNIKRAFDEHPEVDFVGGKVLPEWESAPPDWLTCDHWWPLAIVDHGDTPFYVNSENPICLPTANASFRSVVFQRVGLFSPGFSGREDHELLIRLWRAGSKGMYIPSIKATAQIQPERLERSYHRKWNMVTGKYNSLMRLNEIKGADGKLLLREDSYAITLFGVPAYIYRGLIGECFHWLVAALCRRKSLSLQHANHIWYAFGYINKRYEQYNSNRQHSNLTEVFSFAKALVLKKFNPKS